MKFECFLLLYYSLLISSILAADTNPKHAEEQPSPAINADVDETDEAQLKRLLQATNVAPAASKKVTTKAKAMSGKENKTDISEEELKDILTNITKISNDTKDEAAETTTPYDVKHYLTSEQKYYMLRVNLLGIGIRVVHDIIPIPVANIVQYRKSMNLLLDRVQAVRGASANMTAGKMQNITLEDAHKLQMKMSHINETSSAKAAKTTKPTSHTTELMILGGVIVGLIIIGVLLFVCKRAMDGKSGDAAYYDHLQGGGGAVPMN